MSAEARALYLRGRALNEQLQVHEAHRLFGEAVTVDPTFALGEYALATTAPTARELEAHLAKALAFSEHVSPGERFLVQGFRARKHGDPDGARQFAESLVARYPKDERAHWTLAAALAAQQDYERAITEFRAAIAIAPDYALAFNQLGYAYRSAGRMAEAELSFQRYIVLVPNDPNPYDSYAELLMKTGRFDESIAQYRKALALDEHFGGSYVGIATNEVLAGRHGSGIAEARRYLGVARDDSERRTALLTEAMAHIDHGGTDDALRAMDRRHALAAASGDTVNMAADGVMIADILLEAGRIDAAAARFAAAHALLAASGAAAEAKADDALGARYDAARVALARGDLRAARTEALAYTTGATARRNAVRARQAHALNGRVALAARDFDASLAELASADQQDPEVWLAKSRAYAGRGDRTRATELAEQARTMNILLTLPYVFTRASLAAATQSATSGSAGGKPH